MRHFGVKVGTFCRCSCAYNGEHCLRRLDFPTWEDNASQMADISPHEKGSLITFSLGYYQPGSGAKTCPACPAGQYSGYVYFFGFNDNN